MDCSEKNIKERSEQDEALFADAIRNMADSVTGGPEKGSRREGGMEAIKAVLRYYGFSAKNEPPREVTDFGDYLSYLLSPSGLMARRIRLTEAWWKDCVGPVIAFRRDGGAVALLPDSLGYYSWSGRKKERIHAKSWEMFTGEAYCFYKPFPNRRLKPLDLIKYALFTRSVKDVFGVMLLMGTVTLIGILVPKLTYFLYSTVTKSRSVSLLFSTVFFMICASISSTLFGTFKTMYEEIISTRMSIAVQAATEMRLLSLPPAFFRKYAAGELSERAGYLTSLTETLVSTLFGTGLSALFSLAYIGSIFAYAPGLVIPALAVIIVTVSFSLLVIFSRQKITKEKMEIETKESGMTYAMISGIEKIKISGAEKRAFAGWVNLYAKKIAKEYNPPLFLKLSTVITLAISTAGTLVMYYFAIRTGVNPAEYTAFTAAYGMVYGAFSSVASLATTFSEIRPIFAMAKPIMDCVPEETENKEIVTELTGKIELSHVTFSYGEDGPPAVDDLSLSIKPGQYIGIVGQTGFGKTTLIRLLLGFEKPQKGMICYDGKEIGSLNLKSLRRKIGVVMQDGKLIQGDILTNITLSAPWLTLDEAWAAAEMAGIAEDIAEMPMGMSTMISEGSGGISGGQKQRLLIARAVASKPRILILDEATSALDNITQRKVSESLSSLYGTRIFIAHRLSTIRQCDRILVLDKGRIIEDGTYDSLMEKNGRFAELAARQEIK